MWSYQEDPTLINVRALYPCKDCNYPSEPGDDRCFDCNREDVMAEVRRIAKGD